MKYYWHWNVIYLIYLYKKDSSLIKCGYEKNGNSKKNEIIWQNEYNH